MVEAGTQGAPTSLSAALTLSLSLFLSVTALTLSLSLFLSVTALTLSLSLFLSVSAGVSVCGRAQALTPPLSLAMAVALA